jgi:hypothetical protein
MAAELITPVDELSGIPLSVAPPLERLPRHNPDITNWHHLYHPRSAPELQTLGGMALRNSRIQLLPVRDHNTGRGTYHTYYKGPVLTDNEEEQFRLCVLACSGYLSEEVIDLRLPNGPDVRKITDMERRIFRQIPPAPHVNSDAVRRFREGEGTAYGYRRAKQILESRNRRQAEMGYNNFQYGYDVIRNFFQDYTVRRPLGHIKETHVEEFLSTPNAERQRQLGHWLLAKQSEVAAEGVRGLYQAARQSGSLHPRMPAEPASLIKFKLGSTARREELFPRLQDSLRLGIAA